MNTATLVVFISTFAFVSVTPGMCMMLSLTLGMTIGVRRTLFMMAGELVGVGLVASLSVMGVAAIMLATPEFFWVFKGLGGAYLLWLGTQMWQSKGKLSVPTEATQGPPAPAKALAIQGFVTAVANPKGWAFFMALLPPFLNASQPLAPQMVVLLAIILTLEFASLVLYASGGRMLSGFLRQAGNVRLMNRIAGTLMMGVGVWLWLG